MNNTAQKISPFFVNDDPLITRKIAAAYLGLMTEKTIDKWRWQGKYPELTPTFIGSRVFYRKSVLDAFIQMRTPKARSQS